MDESAIKQRTVKLKMQSTFSQGKLAVIPVKPNIESSRMISGKST